MSGTVSIPKSALDWLNGSGPDSEGHWFGDAPDDAPVGRAFWWRDKFRTLIESEQQAANVVAEVEVKPLEWHGPDVNGDIHARSILAVYTIRKQQGSLGYWLTEVGGYHTTIEKAKAAAEANYRQRILSTLSLPAQEPVHPDDLAVDGFGAEMKAKLAKKRAEGRGGWDQNDECTAEFLSQLLREHVEKGDPVDVGNLAMMLQQRGERITK